MKPLRYSQQKIEEEDIAAVVRVMRSPYLTQGPEIEAFEAELAKYVGAKHAVAVSSGTAALHLAYLVAGRQRVQTSPLSFVATANAALMAGLEVVFVDVSAVTGLVNLRPGAYDVSVPVHYAGRAAPLPVGPNLGLVVEDACHALGAMDFDGCSKVGSCAHSLATVFSFHPVKPITTGEGGAITTNDDDVAARLRLLRSHGRDGDGDMVTLGYNYRMTEMQAALGRTQLSRCEEMRERRLHLQGLYVRAFRGDDPKRLYGALPLGLMLTLSGEHPERHAWHLFPVRIRDSKRDAVKASLNAKGIGAQVHYPPIHLQTYYRIRFQHRPGDFPEAEAWGAEELSLPLHAGMVEADVDRVCKALKETLL